MPRLLPLIAATCAAVLLAAGCTKDDPEPNYSSVTPTASATTSTPTTPPTSTSPTGVPTTGPNVSPGEVAPTRPAEAEAADSAGAIAFVGYYVRTSDWVFATSDTSLLSPFFASGCATCESRAAFLMGLLPPGAHFEGGRIYTKQITIVKNDGRQGADFAVTSVTDVDAAKVVAADGTVLRSFPSATGFQLTDWVKMINGEWKVVEERRV